MASAWAKDHRASGSQPVDAAEVVITEPALVAERPAVGSGRSWLRFLVGFALVGGVLLGAGAVDATGRWGLVVLAAVLATGVAVEKALHRSTAGDAVRLLGLRRPGGRAMALAAAVSGLVLLVFPLTAALSGAAVVLRPDWAWLLVGILAFHGLAEELVWRGYVFRRLRAGRSFRAGVAWTMPLIAAGHLPILVTQGPAVGLGAMLVAAVTSIPLGYLYETGGRSMWPPALVHTAIDAFKLVLIPAVALSTFSTLIILVNLAVPLLVLAVPRHVLVAAPSTERPRGESS
ncbi:CPBP family intramembrane glutamic endopeptidase [Pseudonocardia humida]|nr:CPBP family intramembrane glutamic endopeptidase [Pseudonocardia humida]